MLDIPDEVLTGCGPEETFRPDYKAAAFPYSRPADAPITKPTTSVFKHELLTTPNDCFYFESDHLALKGNEDYLKMLETVVTLQAQRTQAIKDLETLLHEKKKALEMNPFEFIEKLKKGECSYPGPQKIAEIPEIDWTKYHIFKPDQLMRPQTRHANTETSVKRAPVKEDKIPVKQSDNNLISSTKCQPWSCEEQQKLDELLEKYPSEDNEMNRYRKIAEELGTRTAKQVFSRCQKYFKKLQKKGLQIPGRLPKSRSETTKKVKRHKHSNRKSTFFPYEQMMNINPDPMEESISKIQGTEDNLEFSQIELLQLQKVKEENIDDSQETNNCHYGFKCYICNDEPIKGIRWHCEECQNEEVNLCSNCVIAQRLAEEPLHPPTHIFKNFDAPKYSENCDIDYLPHKFNSKNYLDPNFDFLNGNFNKQFT